MGNYYSTNEFDDSFCKKSETNNNYFNKTESDANFSSVIFTGSLNDYYTKEQSDDRYEPTGTLINFPDGYYTKEQADSTFEDSSLMQTIKDQHYTKQESDSRFSGTSVKNQISDLDNELKSNYYDNDQLNNQILDTDELSAKMTNYIQSGEVNGMCVEKQYVSNLIYKYNSIPYKIDTGSTYSKQQLPTVYSSYSDYNNFADKVNNGFSNVFAPKVILLDKQETFADAGSEKLLLNVTSVPYDGIVTCFISMLGYQQSVNGSIYMYYFPMQNLYSTIKSYEKVAGCSIDYIYGGGYELYTNSFSFEVSRGSKYTVYKYTANPSMNSYNFYIRFEYQPIKVSV